MEIEKLMKMQENYGDFEELRTRLEDRDREIDSVNAKYFELKQLWDRWTVNNFDGQNYQDARMSRTLAYK